MLAEAMDDEITRRIPPANREALEVPAGRSLFEATEDGLPVDSVVYNTRSGEVLIGRAMTHQSLINRYAPWMRLDDCVRGDLFDRPRRLELDRMRAAVWVDQRGRPVSAIRAWDNVCDAIDAILDLGLPDGWQIIVDGEEFPR